MKSFASSTLHPGIIKSLEDKEITIPTEIQSETIPVLMDHEGDFVGRSATGTGKTYAFGAPLLSKINTDSGAVQAVIMVPTRELCEQVANELIVLAKHIHNLKIEAVYGGIPLKGQINELSNGAQVVVATPGRMMDLVDRKVIELSKLDYVIFDEADEMLLRGFRTDIDKILATADRNYSTWLFSATMPDEINSIIKRYLKRSLKKVLIGKKEATNADIDHWIMEVPAEEKLTVLLHYIAKFENKKGIVFCRTKSGVQKLYKQLSAHKFTCGAIHGDLPQGLRNKMMDQFREGHVPLLIATDVASRGVDVQDVAYVIQYHIPETLDAYTHRSGRTSRAGKTGVSLTIYFPEEKEKFHEMIKPLNLKLKWITIPNAKDQLVNKAILWSRKIAKQKPVGDKLDSASKAEFKNQLLHMSKDEILEKLLANYLRENQG